MIFYGTITLIKFGNILLAARTLEHLLTVNARAVGKTFYERMLVPLQPHRLSRWSVAVPDVEVAISYAQALL